MSENKQYLLNKIADLEQQLIDRNNELAVFRQELKSTNDKLSKMINVMNKELKISLDLQRYLVPTEFPNIPGFEFSSKYMAGSKLGGDYFDIFSHEDKSKFGIIMASCTGYMLSATLMSTLLKISSLMETRKNPDPTQVVLAIIQDMKKHMTEGHSVDLLYGIFDRKKFELNYVCLGDVIALMQSAKTQKLIPFSEKMQALKFDFDKELKVGKLGLNPRDRLVLATKGSYLVQGHNFEHYGRPRFLQSVISAPAGGVHELRNKICMDIDKYKATGRAERDITVVIAEVKDRVIKLA